MASFGKAATFLYILSELGKALFVHGLRKRFPHLSDEEFNMSQRELLKRVVRAGRMHHVYAPL